jgi:hypothetical protein
MLRRRRSPPSRSRRQQRRAPTASPSRDPPTAAARTRTREQIPLRPAPAPAPARPRVDVTLAPTARPATGGCRPRGPGTDGRVDAGARRDGTRRASPGRPPAPARIFRRRVAPSIRRWCSPCSARRGPGRTWRRGTRRVASVGKERKRTRCAGDQAFELVMIRWSGRDGAGRRGGLDHRPRLPVSNSAGARQGMHRAPTWWWGGRRVEGAVAANARNRWVSAGVMVCRGRGHVLCRAPRTRCRVQELRKGGKDRSM